MEAIFTLIGSFIFVTLGCAHLYLTFFSNKLFPRKSEVIEAMKNDQLRLTRQTTIWNAWIGFNASHSAGIIFFGLINIVMVFCLLGINRAWFIELLNILFCFTYLLLARRYWFKTPFIGVAVATCCFIISFVLTMLNP